MRRIEKISLILTSIVFISCNIKYDKMKWLKDNDGDPIKLPNERGLMLKDLTTNYKLIGLKYSKLIDLLGDPDFVDSTNSEIIYKITVHYDMIDPDYIKDLNFKFNKDSTITSFEITEQER